MLARGYPPGAEGLGGGRQEKKEKKKKNHYLGLVGKQLQLIPIP